MVKLLKNKQTKTIEDQEKNQISAIKEHGKQVIESNEVGKNDFDIDRSGESNEKQKNIFNRLIEERAHELADIKDKIDSYKLVYNFKTGANEPKDFRNYQIPWKLFEDLRDGHINPKEVLKSHTRFKLGLSEIKTSGKKSIHQEDMIRNITTFFDLPEKIIDFFRSYSFLLSEAEYKAKYGEGLKMLASKQMLQRLSIVFAQAKAGNNSEDSLNEIRQIVYSLYQSKEITKKV